MRHFYAATLISQSFIKTGFATVKMSKISIRIFTDEEHRLNILRL